MVRRFALAAFALATVSFGAEAQIFRAYLSTAGSDANPCTLPAPCRLLPAALNAVADGGEVWMLDSGNYNSTTVTIGKNVSVLSVPGAQGSLVANGATAVLVSAAGLAITLRNVNVVPIASARVAGTYGLRLTGASSVTLDHCVFANLPDDAIRQEAGELVVTDTVIRESAGWGVGVTTTQSSLTTITHSRLLRNDSGALSVTPTGVARASVADSAIVGKGTGRAIQASTTTPGAFALASLTRSSVQHTQFSLSATTNGSGTANLTVSGNYLAFNNVNFQQSGVGSAIFTGGDNVMATPTSSDSGSVTAAPVK